MKFEVIIAGFDSKAQAEAFVNWYEGQGEQDASIWFESTADQGKLNITSMNVDCARTFPIVWNGNAITMILQPQ